MARSHATDDTRIERRIWKFPNFPKLRDAVNLRYALFPYIYTMARETYDTGIGMCRPLYYEYPESEEAYRYENEYFFGNDILVAPITEPAAANGVSVKEIWFPEGSWWSVSTNELIEGPCVKTLDFSQDQIPYFFKVGAMIPYNTSAVRNVTTPATTLILNTVAGKGGKGYLYEDSGDNPDYATVFAITKFTHDTQGRSETYTIAPREGDDSNLVRRRSWKLNILNATLPKSVKLNNKTLNASEWEYSIENKTLRVNIPEADCSVKRVVEVKY